jgi:hypothetical protein
MRANRILEFEKRRIRVAFLRPQQRRQWSFCGFAEGKEARAECR